MSGPTQVILINCGSFNPVTIMHLRMFEIAKDHITKYCNAKVIGGIISPVHDGYAKPDLAPSRHRCEMVRRALGENSWISLDDWEAQQSAWLPTRRVLSHYRDFYNRLDNERNDERNRKRAKLNEEAHHTVFPDWDRTSPVTVRLLCGADLVESFKVPDLWQQVDMETILGDHGLAVVSRDNCETRKTIHESDVLSQFEGNIDLITEWFTNEISATKIRRALRRGCSVKYLLQDAVIEYIKDNRLYRPVDNNKYIRFMSLPVPMPMSTTPSPSQDSNVFPPSYELVKGSDLQSPHSGVDNLEIIVPIHHSTSKGSRSLERTDSDSSKFRSETLV